MADIYAAWCRAPVTNPRRRIVAGLFATAYARAALVIGQIVLVPILITRWTVVGYGEWLTISALASYLSYTNVGMPGALRAYMAMAFSRDGRDAMQEAFQSALLLITAMGVCAGIAFTVAFHFLPFDRILNLHWMNQRQAATVAEVLTIQLVMYVIASVLSAALSSIGEYPLAQLLDAHRQSAEFVAMAVFVGAFGALPWIVVFVYPVSWATFLIVTAMMLFRRAPWLFRFPIMFRGKVLRELSRPMLGVLGMTFGYAGMSVQAPRIILAATVGPQATAIYSVASMMMRVVRIPIDIPAHSATVEISLATGRGELSTASGLLSNTTRICVWVALLSVPIVIAIGPLASYIWSRHRVEAPIGVLVLMSISSILLAMSLPCQEGLMAVGRLDRATRWLFVFVIPFLGICWISCFYFGALGAALAVVTLDLLYAVSATHEVVEFFEFSRTKFILSTFSPPIDILRTELGRLFQRARRFGRG